jgi:hypothetical protein
MAEQFGIGYALLIGVNENALPHLALPVVATDIAALHAVLVHPQRCAYPAQHVKVVSGQDATKQGIQEGLDWLYDRLQADTSSNTTALIYYSGHGWQDAQSTPPAYYLIPYDMQAGRTRTRALPAGHFAAAIEELQPRRLLVILDCCHAAGIEAKALDPTAQAYQEMAIPPQLLMAGTKAVAVPGSKDISALAEGAGRAVLSSSQGAQKSYIRRDRSMSIFTYHLLEALTGHAQPLEGASEVLVSDVISYVHRKVPRSAWQEASATQEPDFRVSGNFPVALLLGGKGLSKGEGAPDPLETPAVARVNTGGGAYVRGNVTVGGDFVGRDKISASFGNIGPGAQIATGREIRQTSIGAPDPLTPVELATLQRLLADLRDRLAALDDLSQRERVLAEDRIVQIEEALVTAGEPPAWSTLQRAGDWLLQNAPSLAGTLGRLFLHPLVGRVVEAAGDVAAAWVRDRFRQETK